MSEKKKSGWIGLIGYIACIASVIPVHQIGAGVFLLFGVILMLWLLVWTPEISESAAFFGGFPICLGSMGLAVLLDNPMVGAAGVLSFCAMMFLLDGMYGR